jgi:Bacterial transcriptional regulator
LRPLGEVFPAHLVSGGKLLLAALPPEQFEALYRVERWQDRLDERPDPDALAKELAVVRKRGFAINKDRTEPGVYAAGRALRIGDCPAAAALALAMPTVRFSAERLPGLVALLASTAQDIEQASQSTSINCSARAGSLIEAFLPCARARPWTASGLRAAGGISGNGRPCLLPAAVPRFPPAGGRVGRWRQRQSDRQPPSWEGRTERVRAARAQWKEGGSR